MAKGFTVKASKPKGGSKGPEWDYDAIKQRMRGKTIVFCLPGKWLFICVYEELCATML